MKWGLGATGSQKSSTILDLVGSNQFFLYPQWLWHSFKKGCALFPSLVSHSYYIPIRNKTLGPLVTLSAKDLFLEEVEGSFK